MSTDDSGQNIKAPWGLKWRCSTWFVTAVVGLGVTTDLIVYSVIVPIIPFQLEALGYAGVSGLVGWLLFAYSGGLVVFTPPIALISETYKTRQVPLILGLVALIGAQIMLMEAPKYWVMIVARILQGMSSSVVWIVALALLCDTVPEAIVGRQLGIAMSGLSIGFLIGPPVSGALYSKFGFRGPFIFGIVVAAVDLIGRLLIIERKDALRYGHDPAEPSRKDEETVDEGSRNTAVVPDGKIQIPEKSDIRAEVKGLPSAVNTQVLSSSPDSAAARSETTGVAQADVGASPVPDTKSVHLTMIGVILAMCKSSRALAVFLLTLFWGLLYTSMEPALPLYLQAEWNFNASKVGLIYIAAVVPTIFSSPLSGYLCDRFGTGLTAVLCMLIALPWYVVLLIKSSLALFVVFFAFANFFGSGIVSPITTELATVARDLEGVGYAHIYGAFNLAYGIGSALGPMIGGQMYDHLREGWMAICILCAGLLVAGVLIASAYFEETPLLIRALRRQRGE